MNKKIQLALIALMLYGISYAQSFWTPVAETSIKQQGKRQIIPQKYLTFALSSLEMKNKLFSSPQEKNVNLNNSPCIISLPVPNGTSQNFRVVESPIMADELAVSFPDVKTFSIKGIDDPYANGKLDWSDAFGFHGMVRTPEGDFFIDPYSLNDINNYITYYTADFLKNPSDILPEVGVIETEQTKAENKNFPSQQKQTSANKTETGAVCVGAQLRSYRLAVGCTGEYAIAATGQQSPTVGQTLAKIVTSVNRVDGVYESEVAIRMVLIPTETLVVFTDPNTDPYNGNNNSGVLIAESQTVITNAIGTSNFDIGHTFSTGGGGLANLQAVCKITTKASGITGSSNPVGDPYDIDYVAHEMGHQFGGNHPFNANTGSCQGNRNGPTSVEPGSGITIMAYAGICGSANDLAAHSIPYFHAISYDEIVNYTNGSTGNNCATIINTGNNPPTVTGSANYVVPASTPFSLTGSATDPDGDPLTYSWEEIDPGSSSGNWNSGNAPFFRSYAPTTSATRWFPIQNVALSGNFTGTKGEYLPSTAQTLDFRLTARDNKANGGGVCYDFATITVDATSSFSVTYPNASGIVWGMQSQKTITWDNTNTDQAPVSCDSVRIYISYNGGSTYSVLLNSTPNDGAEIVIVPTVSVNIATCRIKVESIGNVFYDWSDKNFTITTDVGVSEISENDPVGLSVWPNPSSGRFNFAVSNLNYSSDTKITVQDVLGKTLLQNTYINKSELKETLDLSNFSRGVYFVKVNNDNKQSVYRIIKE